MSLVCLLKLINFFPFASYILLLSHWLNQSYQLLDLSLSYHRKVHHCGLLESTRTWDGTGCEFDSLQCRISGSFYEFSEIWSDIVQEKKIVFVLFFWWFCIHKSSKTNKIEVSKLKTMRFHFISFLESLTTRQACQSC